MAKLKKRKLPDLLRTIGNIIHIQKTIKTAYGKERLSENTGFGFNIKKRPIKIIHRTISRKILTIALQSMWSPNPKWWCIYNSLILKHSLKLLCVLRLCYHFHLHFLTNRVPCHTFEKHYLYHNY